VLVLAVAEHLRGVEGQTHLSTSTQKDLVVEPRWEEVVEEED